MIVSEVASSIVTGENAIRQSRTRRDLRRSFRATVHVVIAIIRMRKFAIKNNSCNEEDDTESINVYEKGSHLITPNYFYEESGVRHELDYIQRIFVTFEYQDASILSQVIFYVLILAIILGVVLFILAGDPRYNITPDTCDQPACDNDEALCPGQVICPPQPPPVFSTIDGVCVIVFTVDYLSRVLTCWSVPAALAGVNYVQNDDMVQRSALMRVALYILRPANLIDVCAILPFYIGLGLPSGGSGSSSFVRVLRLARLLRMLKLGKNNRIVNVLTTAISLSIPALCLAIFLMGLATIVCASIFYIVEMGTFKVTSDYPEGAYLRPTLLGDDEEVSPYQSIALSIYYTIITQVTVGYGDIYPTSNGGRAMACIVAFSGVLVLALPVSVVGTNFQSEYAKYVEMLEREKEAKEAAARAAGSSRKKKSVRNFLGAINERIKHVGRVPSFLDSSTHSCFATEGGGFDVIPEPRGVHREVSAEFRPVVECGMVRGKQHTDRHAQQSPNSSEEAAKQVKQFNKTRLRDLDNAIKRCRLAVSQHKQGEEKLNSSRKLRRALIEKHLRRIASLKAAALPLVAPKHYIYENEQGDSTVKV